MHFKNAHFETIESDAFASISMKLLVELKFENIQMIKCMDGWGHGLTLKKLIFENSGLRNAKYDFLDECNTNKIIMYNSLRNTRIIDILGIGVRNELYDVTIENANYMQRISIMDFTAIRYAKRLILANCGIESIAEHSFSFMQRLRELNLTANHLKTLPATIFNILLEKRKLLSVLLGNNEWDCKCELINVKNILNRYGIKFHEFPNNCVLPGQFAIESTYKNNSYNARYGDGTIIYDKPINCTNSTEKIIQSSCRTQYGFNFIYVSYPKITIHIDNFRKLMFISTNEKMYFSIRIPQYLSNNNQQRMGKCHFYHFECKKYENYSTGISIDYLPIETIQTYCFSNSKYETKIWLINCITFCIECNYSDRVWFRIDSEMFAIVILLAVISSTLLLGMVSGYILVRLRPALLNGSDRIVILGKRKGRRESVTIFIMPSNYVNPSEIKRYIDNVLA